MDRTVRVSANGLPMQLALVELSFFAPPVRPRQNTLAVVDSFAELTFVAPRTTPAATVSALPACCFLPRPYALPIQFCEGPARKRIRAPSTEISFQALSVPPKNASPIRIA